MLEVLFIGDQKIYPLMHSLEDMLILLMYRKRLPARAFPGAVLPPRGRWMCCGGFPWAFGLPSTAAAKGTSP